MGSGAKEESLIISQQGAAGGDSEEVRFVVGIHFPWVSQGWEERGGLCVGFSSKELRGTQPLSSTLGTTGLDVGNSERWLHGAGTKRWVARELWADTSAESTQLVGGTAGLSLLNLSFSCFDLTGRMVRKGMKALGKAKRPWCYGRRGWNEEPKPFGLGGAIWRHPYSKLLSNLS